MGLKLDAILIGIIVICLAIAGALYYRGNALKSQGEVAVANITTAVQGAAVEQGKQNQEAQKKITPKAKKDQEQVQVVEEEIKELPERYLNEVESRAVRNLIHHFMCGGELPSGGADCLNYPSVLSPTDKTPLVSIREFIGACEQISEYCHAWERTGTCYEESMSKQGK
jgi:hypothetical protein